MIIYNLTFNNLGWALTEVTLSDSTDYGVEGSLVYTFSRGDHESFDAARDIHGYVIAESYDLLDEALVSDFGMSDENAESFVDALGSVDQILARELRSEATRLAQSL